MSRRSFELYSNVQNKKRKVDRAFKSQAQVRWYTVKEPTPAVRSLNLIATSLRFFRKSWKRQINVERIHFFLLCHRKTSLYQNKDILTIVKQFLY